MITNKGEELMNKNDLYFKIAIIICMVVFLIIQIFILNALVDISDRLLNIVDSLPGFMTQ